MRSAANRVFAFLLLLSGFCGIAYEVLYARLLGNVVGDQFAVSAAILLTFLLGIGCGTLFADALWRYLWLLEAFIGLCGIAFALGTSHLDAWLYAALPGLGPGVGSSILVCSLLLGAPAFAIGTSLPLFAGYLSRLHPGRVFARAYTVYNFGAAVTVLLIEFALLRALGLRGAVLLVASLNIVVAAALRLGYGELRSQRPAPATSSRYPASHLAALALASLGSAVFQLLMLKIAECVLGPFRETFALVLAIVFLGIALGSTITERLRLGFDTLMAVSLVGLLGLLAGFPLVARVYAWAYAPVVSLYPPAVPLYHLALLALLMGVPALAFGATIPALLTAQTNVARESGRLLFVSSLANAAGFLLMALVLHPLLDYGTILVVIVALCAGAALVYRASTGRLAWATIALLLAALVGQRTLWDETLLYVGYTSFDDLAQLRRQRERMTLPERFKGHQDLFSINRQDGDPWFFINGYTSIRLNTPSERLVGAFASTFAPRNDRALVLGLGSGATAGTVGLLFERTDAVEISPVVLENLFRMAEYNFDIENTPGVRIVQDDGFHFVKSSHEKYSLVVNTVTTPLYFSASKLYTREFLRAVRQRMTADGVYVTWMDRRVGDRGAQIILRTLGDNFRYCWLGAIKSAYYLLLCSGEPLAVHQPEIVAAQPRLRAFFHGEHGLPAEWIPFGLLSTRILETARDAHVPLNTLDYPALEFEMARLVGHRGYEGFLRSLVQTMSVEDVSRAMQGVPQWNPVRLLLYSEALLGKERGPAVIWRRLVERAVPDFPARYTAERIDYLGGVAQAAGTADALGAYGEALAEAGRVRDALDPLQRALALDPQSAPRQFSVGMADELLGELDTALTRYGRAAELDPTNGWPRYRRGVVLARLRRYPEALAEFDAALQLGEGVDLHLARGRVLLALGQRDRALEAYRAALRLDPDNAEAREALARLASGG